jgi:hypothetical protein
MDEIMKEKRCSRCKKMKSLDQFHKNVTGRYGVNAICKACKQKEWRKYNESRESKSLKPSDDFKGLVQERPMVQPGRDCALCENRLECHRRVVAGLWLLCEIPDLADIFRAADRSLRAERTQLADFAGGGGEVRSG